MLPVVSKARTTSAFLVNGSRWNAAVELAEVPAARVRFTAGPSVSVAEAGDAQSRAPAAATAVAVTANLNGRLIGMVVCPSVGMAAADRAGPAVPPTWFGRPV